MKLSGTVMFSAPREKVFAALTDPAVLQHCIEGCEKMLPVGPDSYDAQMKVGIAMFKGNYTGRLSLGEKKSFESFALSLEGKGAPGFVKGKATVALTDKGAQTEVRYDADAQVGGLIAAVGSRLIEGAARKMAEDFFKRLQERLGRP